MAHDCRPECKYYYMTTTTDNTNESKFYNDNSYNTNIFTMPISLSNLEWSTLMTTEPLEVNPGISKIKEWIRTLEEISKIKDKSRVLKFNTLTVRDELLKMLGEEAMKE